MFLYISLIIYYYIRDLKIKLLKNNGKLKQKQKQKQKTETETEIKNKKKYL